MTIWEAIDNMPDTALLWKAAQAFFAFAALCVVVWLGAAMLRHPR